MTPRSQRSPQERDARSRAVQLLADQPLLRGSLVLQHRSCGKPYCRCQKGQKHPALYLHTRSGDRRVRIYIPPALHDTARRWVEQRPPGQAAGRSRLRAPLPGPAGPEASDLRSQGPSPLGGPRAVMARFCSYAEKVFRLSERFPTLTDSRARPRIKTAAAFAAAFTLFATRRGSLNGLEQDLRIPARLQGLVGAGPPSVDSIGRIYALMGSRPLRRLLRDVAHRLKRNKAPHRPRGLLPRGRRWS